MTPSTPPDDPGSPPPPAQAGRDATPLVGVLVRAPERPTTFEAAMPLPEPAGIPADPDEPNMLQQTLELATALKRFSDRDPEGRPSAAAVAVFHRWLAAARAMTQEPQYFDDVLGNYDAAGRSNKDLFDMFELLHPYVEIIDDRDFPEDDPDGGGGGDHGGNGSGGGSPVGAGRGRTFIGLPTV